MLSMLLLFFFKQKTAYELRISDWSSDVCSSDLRNRAERREQQHRVVFAVAAIAVEPAGRQQDREGGGGQDQQAGPGAGPVQRPDAGEGEVGTAELARAHHAGDG